MNGRVGLRARRILVVEDEFLIARAISTSLEDVEASVVGPVGDVAGALRLIEAEGPLDAALLDINLRGVHSYAVADALLRRGVPFLFLSGYERDVIPPRYEACPWRQKPFTASTLIATVAALIRDHEARRSAAG